MHGRTLTQQQWGARKRPRWLITGFAWLLSSFAVAQPVVPPATPAGHVLGAWLEAFNSGEDSRLAAFTEKYQWRDALATQLARRRQSGGYELTGVRQSEPQRVEFFLKARADGQRLLARMSVNASDSPSVTSTYFAALPAGDAPVIGFAIDPQTRDQVIEQTIEKLQGMYILPATGKRLSDFLRLHLKHHDYNLVTEGDVLAFTLTAQMRELSRDRHLAVHFSPVRLPEDLTGPDPQRRLSQQRHNCWFDKVETLPDSVGYVKLDAFESVEDCSPTAVAAMGFLANSDALIFDLRDNGGGDPGMVAFLCSYLFGTPTHLNDVFDRSSNTTRQSWTLAEVPGKRLPSVPVYVLTSARTFSGAEEFSYSLQSLKRATIVGEVTGGGAHLVRPERLDDRFFIDMPFARAVNPVTNTDWEGRGVQPDVVVAAEDALTTAQKLAREKLKGGT